jgi:hypothetical protein
MRLEHLRAATVLALAGLLRTACGLEGSEFFAPITPSTDDFRLPREFVQRIADRVVVDAYQNRRHRADAGPGMAPRRLFAAPTSAGRFITVVHPELKPAVWHYRSTLPEGFIPLPGFRAPILEHAGEMPPALPPGRKWGEREIAAAEQMARRLAHDGLLPTLARVIEILGPDRFGSGDPASVKLLEAAGCPVDLLTCFSTPGDSTASRPSGLLAWIARRLESGATAVALKAELAELPFQFAGTHPPFLVATESGEHELALLRVQLGGGYDRGIVPGANIDVICQLVGALPSVDFVISVPEPHFEPFHQMASQAWRLRRTNHVTLIREPLSVGPWAQDNGKAGWIRAGLPPGTETQRLATLAPRYASVGEDRSEFRKGESFLMEGLHAAGHAVAHSRLHFQGGNLLAVRDPKSGDRLLLIGEAELHRNTALGLTRAQVLEGFRAEFGVDRCVVVPAGSYHLDFDVSLRAHHGELIAFVNDTLAAARMVVGIGMDALQKAGVLPPERARACRADLASGRYLELVGRIRTVISSHSRSNGNHSASLSRLFASGPTDSAEGNFQCFLLALDLIESSQAEKPEPSAARDTDRADYLQALQRLNASQQAQIEVFRSQGWKVAPIPSMADLHRGINYLNGIQHRHGYVMPTFGGLYAPLDQEAMAAFRQVLGTDFRITPILCAESQRSHGGVHCTAAAYPRL